MQTITAERKIQTRVFGVNIDSFKMNQVSMGKIR